MTERFIERITDMGERSDRIFGLRPVNYAIKGDESHSIQYGLVSEEVARAMPELATFDILFTPVGLRSEWLPFMLLNELQKLRKRVEELEKK